ncbi:hypothetical protein LEMLEM_LOCUS22050 [Lemmus lemmus]
MPHYTSQILSMRHSVYMHPLNTCHHTTLHKSSPCVHSVYMHPSTHAIILHPSTHAITLHPSTQATPHFRLCAACVLYQFAFCP